MLNVIRNFKQVIETRNIHKMNKELYQFLTLHCGFIAHFDIGGFKATYSDPMDFAEVFIRHFDPEHKYFNPCYPCHDEPYKNTACSKADIKHEFIRIVDEHKAAIARWAADTKREELFQLYLQLIEKFDGDGSVNMNCDVCGNTYSIIVRKDGNLYTDFRDVCCVFCGQQIKLYQNQEVIQDVERANSRKAQPFTRAL